MSKVVDLKSTHSLDTDPNQIDSADDNDHGLTIGALYQLVHLSNDLGYCVDLKLGALWLTRESLSDDSERNHVIDWLHPGEIMIPLEILPWTAGSSQGPMIDVMILSPRGPAWILALRKSLISTAFLRISHE